MKNHTIAALATTSLLALSGCSFSFGGPQPPVFESRSTPSHTSKPTASSTPQEPKETPAENSSASPSRTATPEFTVKSQDLETLEKAFPERTMPFATAEDYWRANQELDPSQGKLTMFADPADPAQYPLTETEKQHLQEGQYVAATEKHPAFNVPKPEVPAVLAHGGRAEEMGAEFAQYWIETLNYLVATGQTDELDPITAMPNLTIAGQIISAYTNIYSQNAWIDRCTYEMEIVSDGYAATTDKTVDIFIPIKLKHNDCTLYDGQQSKTEPGETTGHVAQIRYRADTKQYSMIGFIEATGRYYDLPATATGLVCTYTPEHCPQETYDALRADLKAAITGEDSQKL